MPHCRYLDCKEEVENAGDLCPTHHLVLLQRVQRHLSDEDSQFLLKHINGCFIGVVADYLGREIDTIDKLLTLDFEELTFGGPGQFLDQRKLIRVLLHRESLRQVEEEIAKQEAARKAKAAQVLMQREAAPVQVAPPEQATTKTPIEPEKPTRYGRRATDKLTARDVGRLLEVSDTAVRGWMDEGLLPYEEIPLGDKGRVMKVIKMADLVAFVQSCFGNWRFARCGEGFSRFLRDQTNESVAVS